MYQGVWSVCSLVEGGNERRERGDGPLGPLLVEGGARARTPLGVCAYRPLSNCGGFTGGGGGGGQELILGPDPR